MSRALSGLCFFMLFQLAGYYAAGQNTADQNAAWLEQGKRLLELRQTNPAEKAGRQVLKALTDPKDSIEKAQQIAALDLIGRCFEIDIEFDSAVYYKKHVLRLTKELYGYSSVQTAKYLDYLAGFYAGRSCADTSFFMRQSAFDILEKLYPNDSAGVRDVYAKVCNNLAALYGGKGEFERSRQYIDKGLTLASIDGKESPRHYLLIQSAVRFAQIGKKEEAKQHLDMVRRSLPQEARAQSYFLLACAEYQRSCGQTDSVLYYHQQQLKSLTNLPIGPTDRAHCHLSIAFDYIELKDFSTAIPHLDSVIAIEAPIYGDHFPTNFIALRLKGVCFENLGDTASASQFYQRALESNGYKGCSVEKLRAAGEGIQSFIALANLASASGADSLAIEFYLRADSALYIHITRMEDTGGRMKLSSDFRPFYEKALSIIYRHYEKSSNQRLADLAFHFVERFKSCLAQETYLATDLYKISRIPDSLSSRLFDIRRLKSNYLQTRWAAIDRLNESKSSEAPETHPKVQNISAKLADLDAEELTLETLFDSLSTSYRLLKRQSWTFSPSEISRNALEPQARDLLEYWVDQHGVYIFTLSDGQLGIHHESIDRDTLRAWVQRFRLGITGSRDEDAPMPGNFCSNFLDYGYRLFRQVIRPVIGSVHHSSWVVVPDDCLWQLPFDALLTKQPGSTKNFKDQPYLVKKVYVSYSGSGNELLWLGTRRQPQPRAIDFVGFAPFYDKNPDSLALFFPGNKLGSGWDTLNQSGRPVAAGRAAFPQNSSIYTSSEAGKQRFKEVVGQCRIFELFTHAVADPIHWEKSCLIFRKKQGDKPVEDSLFAAEIMGLNLNADLALIIGCGTGIGKIHSSIGAMSLGRAFLYAGAKCTLGTLWSVTEKPTSDLITYFFAGIQRGFRPDVALGEAKRVYLKTAENNACMPYYWAGLFLEGESAILFGKN